MTSKRPHTIYRGNVLLQYSVFMLAIISVIAAILGAALMDFVRGHVIRMHGEFYSRTL